MLLLLWSLFLNCTNNILTLLNILTTGIRSMLQYYTYSVHPRKKLVPRTPPFHPPNSSLSLVGSLSYPPPKLSPAVDCYVIVVAAVRFIVLLAIVVVDDVLSPSRLGRSGIHHDNMAANFWQITASPLTLKPCSTMPLVLHFNHGDQFWPI